MVSLMVNDVSAGADEGVAQPAITWEKDGPPIVRILGSSLRRAAARPDVAKHLRAMRGRVALSSTVDPQAATIHFDRGAINLTHGVHRDADVLIRADLNTLGRPGAPKPRVTGAVRHPRLALGVAKALDSPPPGEWPAAVDELWAWAAGRGGRPDLLRVVCTDDGAEHVVGQAGGTRVEVHGPAWALTGVFTGGDHVGAALLEGRVWAVGDLPVLSSFVGVLTGFMLGEDGR
jgi:hypothetical protein